MRRCSSRWEIKYGRVSSGYRDVPLPVKILDALSPFDVTSLEKTSMKSSLDVNYGTVNG